MSVLHRLSRLEHLMPLRRFARDYPEVHMGLGLFGNTLFFVGSVFFLFEPLRTPGTWLFILGSLGMLLDTVGATLLKLEGFEAEA